MRATYSRELILRDELDRLGIETFLPLRHKRVETESGEEMRQVPAVHNLIFVHSTQERISELKHSYKSLEPLRYMTRPSENGHENTIIRIPESQMSSFLQVASFNYDEHAMIYYTNDMPHPTKEHEEFLKAGMQRLREILDISEGRALVLFTSKSDMKRVAQELRKMELPYRILVQGPGSSQEDVLNAFRDDEHAVLFGTGSFWEGISVEGKTLSNLVIFRLPFSVPDPITAEKEAGKKDPLMEVRVPEMIIKLKQGVGRLIRNEDDKGIVSIIDSRMGDRSSVPYKERVWDALPIKSRTCDLEEIRRFYQKVVMMESATTES